MRNCGVVFTDSNREEKDGYMAEVTPPSLAMTSQVVARDPPPLAILAPGFLLDSQLSAPLAPDVAEAVDRVEVIPGLVGHEVSVSSPCAPSFATDTGPPRGRKHAQDGNQVEEVEG